MPIAAGSVLGDAPDITKAIARFLSPSGLCVFDLPEPMRPSGHYDAIRAFVV